MAESNYDTDLNSAIELIRTFVDFSANGGNACNWATDALNNEWEIGLTTEQWVARALVRMKYGQ